MSIYKIYGVLWFGAVGFWILAFFTAGFNRFGMIITAFTLILLSYVFREKEKNKKEVDKYGKKRE